jgi:hypothetical protein
MSNFEGHLPAAGCFWRGSGAETTSKLGVGDWVFGVGHLTHSRSSPCPACCDLDSPSMPQYGCLGQSTAPQVAVALRGKPVQAGAVPPLCLVTKAAIKPLSARRWTGRRGE